MRSAVSAYFSNQLAPSAAIVAALELKKWTRNTGVIAIGARSATVIGPDGGLADALATSLVVAGQDGAAIFMKPELSEYRVWVIPRNEDIAWSIGKLPE